MIEHYSSCGSFSEAKDYVKYFFGPDTSALPGFYMQKGIDFFVEHAKLYNSPFFSSTENMINTMTIFPFYMNFLNENDLGILRSKFNNFKYYENLENIAGIRRQNWGIEGALYIKYCPVCSKAGLIYFKREHQIPGNHMCWEHKCVLKKISFNSVVTCTSLAKMVNHPDVSSFSFDKKETILVSKLSDMIHEIMKNGFKAEVSTLKTKLCHRLIELNFLDSTGFLHDNLIQLLDADFLYQHTSIRKEIMLAIGKSEKQNKPNPIIYLVLIYRLFGSLEKFYSYKMDNTLILFDGGVPNQYMRYARNEWILTPLDIDYYVETMPKEFFDEYIIVGDTKELILLKHRVCGEYLTSPKNRGVCIKRCSCCGNKQYETFLKNNQNLDTEVSYTRYLSTSEYAGLHDKETKQITIYCKNNRIPGALKIGSRFWIPKDAQYPKDRRFKK